MKVVSSWPDYALGGIVAVTEDGEVFRLPILDGGRAICTEWLQVVGPIKRQAFPRVPPTSNRASIPTDVV